MSTIPLSIMTYADQAPTWPESGRHILAQYDETSIIVYQAYQPAIGKFAVEHGHFGGPNFSFSRMTWIKPNFLWMMYRSGWGTKEGQEITLGLRLRCEFFDSLLSAAVASTWDQALYKDQQAWQAAIQNSEVRLQWDPDHTPTGANVERRAIQLGMRGDTMKAFAGEQLLEVIDLTAFVAEQRQQIEDRARLQTPAERVYVPSDPAIRERLRLDAWVG